MTAYEVRISDWSSDVCSSDLVESDARGQRTAYGDEVGSRVDALATNELTLPIEQEGEGITFERTAQHDLVVAARRARHLQLDVELVGPEPRHGLVETFRAQERRSEERRVGKEGGSTCRSRW